MKKLLVAGLAMLGSLGVVTTAVAETIVVLDKSSLVLASEISEFETQSTEMVGMTVTANFSDNTSESIGWIVQDAALMKGGVIGGGWSLFQTDDTYDEYAPWILTSNAKSISSLVLEGMLGGVVFDIDLYSRDANGEILKDIHKDPIQLVGTTGSGLGWAFEVLANGTNYSGIITATYSKMVSVVPPKGSGIPFGDVFSQLTIEFGTAFGPSQLAKPATLTFRADTDKMKAPIPEPTTLLLFATGLAGLAAVGRRRRS